MTQTTRTELRRMPSRGSHDRETIYPILDAGFLASVGFCKDGQPFVIPTLYGRKSDKLYLHGSAASRLLCELEGGVPVCVCVTLVDGLVLARSAFHHSMNYRSVVAFGTARGIEEPVQKLEALRSHLRTPRAGTLERCTRTQRTGIESNQGAGVLDRRGVSQGAKRSTRWTMRTITDFPFGPECCRLRCEVKRRCPTSD